MKRMLILVMAVLAVVSTFGYAGTAGHYPLVVAMGVVASLYLIDKQNKV
ncbi:hypothetical protein GFY24_35225 [Nocardia sp. SYP-A9097]|nr:hypothetical protein [Nocardia sp. SYP-A9097]MRH92614.1 hypothetical protein [Nocardia sp. SYP-A9097]